MTQPRLGPADTRPIMAIDTISAVVSASTASTSSSAGSSRPSASAREPIHLALAAPGWPYLSHPALGRRSTRTTHAPKLKVPRVVRGATSLVRFPTGSMVSDGLFLPHYGTLKGATGIRPYTRSYVQATEGPLRFRHGSKAPASSILSNGQLNRLRKKSPGKALDAMGKIFGADVHFAKMARSKDFYDPSEVAWWGMCLGWSWTALSPKINQIVDVDGPAGKRGRWFAGEWLSRADLGNWAMSVSDGFAQLAGLSDSTETIGNVHALDLLRAFRFIVTEGAGGFVADIHNDIRKGTAENWNQPFVAGDISVKKVPKSVTRGVLKLAKEDDWDVATQVKLVQLKGYYAAEQSDDYEGPPVLNSKTWNMYIYTNAEHKALWGIMADDPRLRGIKGLPVTRSDAPPDYISRLSRTLLEDAWDGNGGGAIDRLKYGDEFEFFMHTVLQNSVPGTEREAFENAVQRLPGGRISPSTQRSLKKRYPNVANAYSPDQWIRGFASRGLTAKAFGAVF